MRWTASAALLTAMLLAACATTKTPDQVRVEGLAQECLAQRDRDTLETIEVDRFGRVWVYGRQTARWTQERDALWRCLEGKGIRSTGRAPTPAPGELQRWQAVVAEGSGSPRILGAPYDTLAACREALETLAKRYPTEKLACEVERRN